MKRKFILPSPTILLLFWMVTLCSSCIEFLGFDDYSGSDNWEIIPGGLKTSVSGRFQDYNLGTPFKNTKVYILEYIDDPVQHFTFSKYMDSTTTDHNGNYTMSFITSGVGVQYRVGFRPTGMNYWGCYSPENAILNMGGHNEINSFAAKFSILKARAIVIDNPYRPLMAYTGPDSYYSYGNYYSLNKINEDSTLFLGVLPNRINFIHFSAIVSDTTYHSFVHEQIDTIDMVGNFNDTIEFQIELHPTEFKKRPY
jgi:hypothetical protein